MPPIILASNAPSVFSATEAGSSVVTIGQGGVVMNAWGYTRVTSYDASYMYMKTGTNTLGTNSVVNLYITEGGDSGGGSFIFNSSSGVWELAGIHHGSASAIMENRVWPYAQLLRKTMDPPKASTNLGATVVWDSNGATSPTNQDGGGFWDWSNSNWMSPTGGAQLVWNDVNNDVAQFGVGSGSNTAYLVTNAPSLTAGGVIFQNQAYNLVGSKLILGGTNPVITVNATTGKITSDIDGCAGFTKEGAGTLSLLSGLSKFSGNVVVNKGTLVAQKAAAVSGTMGDLGPANTAHTITVNSNASLSFSVSDVFGGNDIGTNTTLIINAGGTVNNAQSVGNCLGSIVLNGGSLVCFGGTATNDPSWSLMGVVTCNSNSIILPSGAYANIGVCLGAGDSESGQTFYVGAGATLTSSVPLLNGYNSINAMVVSYLNKTGAGTLLINSNATYSGMTTIDGGTLALGGTGSISNTPVIQLATNTTFDVTVPGYTVLNGQELRGLGQIKGAVTNAAGSRLAPGYPNTVGTLTFKNPLMLNVGATNQFKLGTNTTAGTTYDQVVAGTLNVNSLDFEELSFATNAGFGPGVYVLFNATNLVGSLGPTTIGPVGANYGILSLDAVNKDVVLTVMGGNNPAVITEGSSTNIVMSEDGSPLPFSLTLNATDPDGDTLAWSVKTQATNGTAAVSGTGPSKAISFTPAANYNGVDRFVVQVTDGKGGTATMTVNMTILSVLDPPVANSKTEWVLQNVSKAITVTGYDPDAGDTLSYLLVTGPASGTLAGTLPNVIYTPATNFVGNDSFTFDITDGLFTSTVAAISVKVTATGGTCVWVNASGGMWSATSNWLDSAVSDGWGSTADFSTLDITTNTVVHLDSARTNGNFIFSDTVTNGSFNWVLDNNGNAANILTLAGPAPTITVNNLGASNVIMSGVISGTNGLIKSGVGTLIPSAVNTYTGPTVINGGKLAISNDGNLGAIPGSSQSNNITLNGGTLQITANITTHANRGIYLAGGTSTLACSTGGNGVHANAISGPGNLDINITSSEYRLTVANTYTGDTRLTGNAYGLVLNPGGERAFQNSTITYKTDTDTLFLTASNATFGGISGNWNLVLRTKYTPYKAVAVSVGNNDKNTTFGGVISDIGSITKIGTGTLTLTTNNTYTGGTTNSSGALQLGDGVSRNGSVLSNIVNNATLIFANPTAQTFDGVIKGAGSLIKTGAGTLTLTASNTYAGATTISNGTMSVSNACLCTTSSVYIVSGAKLDLSFNGSNTVNSLYLGGAQMAPGIYGSAALGGASYFSGNGVLNVTNGPAVTSYPLTISAGPNGWVVGTSDYYPAGTNIQVQAVASNYYSFLTWTGTVTSGANPLTVVMSNAQSVVATFAEILATNSTPQWWLAGYGVTNGSLDDQALGDADGDGMLNWQEWVAGTNPTNAASRLSITNVVMTADGKMPLIFNSVTGKTYQVWQISDLLGTNWSVAYRAAVAGGPYDTNAIPGTGSTITNFVQPGGASGFYRIGVQ